MTNGGKHAPLPSLDDTVEAAPQISRSFEYFRVLWSVSWNELFGRRRQGDAVNNPTAKAGGLHLPREG